MCYSQIWQNIRGEKYLCKLGKKYLNASLCKFVVNSLQHSETFDVSHDFLPLTIAELSTLKQIRFFGPPCTYEAVKTTTFSLYNSVRNLYIALDLIVTTRTRSPLNPLGVRVRVCLVCGITRSQMF